MVGAAGVATSFALGLLLAAPVLAAPRTFVSTKGVDAGVCSLSAPCRSLNAAMGQTSPGGEIIVLDSGGYGPVTVAQSVTVTAPDGVYAGISVLPGNTGVTIDAPTDAVVVLGGLTINGQGGTTGIAFDQGAELRVERCRISGLSDSGIVAQLSGGAVVTIADSLVSGNSNAGIRASGAGHVSLTNVHVTGNGAFGVLLQDGPDVSLHNSLIEQNRWGVGAFSSTGDVLLEVANSRIFSNQSHGVWANSYGAGTNVVSVTVTDSEIVRNNQGVGVPSGGIFAQASLQQSVRVSVARTRLSYNHGAGLYLQLQFPSGPASATAYVAQSFVQGNTGYGVTTIGSAAAYTTGDNTVEENAGGDLNGNVLAYPGPK